MTAANSLRGWVPYLAAMGWHYSRSSTAPNTPPDTPRPTAPYRPLRRGAPDTGDARHHRRGCAAGRVGAHRVEYRPGHRPLPPCCGRPRHAEAGRHQPGRHDRPRGAGRTARGDRARDLHRDDAERYQRGLCPSLLCLQRLITVWLCLADALLSTLRRGTTTVLD